MKTMMWMGIAALPIVATMTLGAATANGGREDAKTTGLKRVVDEPRDDGETFDAKSWKKRLGASDLAEREKAFSELADLARRDADARKAVEEWAKADNDSELAWTSRLLRREIQRGHGLSGGLFRNPGTRGFGGNPGWNGSDWDEFSRRFEDLDSMFGDLRQEWGDMLRNLPAPSGSSNSSRSIELQTGPDGVKCTVTEEVDGKPEKHTYEAKSMEELLDAHPELRENLGGLRENLGGGSFRMFRGSPHGGGIWIDPNGRFGVAPRGDSLRALREDGTDADGKPRTDRLGITCRELPKERADELGIDSGVGLEVQDVASGSIAGLLGLRHGDVVTEVNGTKIQSPEDVRKILADRAADADVAVVVVGDDGHRRTLTWKPSAGDKKSSEKASGSKKSSRDL